MSNAEKNNQGYGPRNQHSPVPYDSRSGHKRRSGKPRGAHQDVLRRNGRPTERLERNPPWNNYYRRNDPYHASHIPRGRFDYGDNRRFRPKLKKRRSLPEKKLSRPPSPGYGNEERTLKKIDETSDMIYRAMMLPSPPPPDPEAEASDPPEPLPNKEQSPGLEKQKDAGKNVANKKSENSSKTSEAKRTEKKNSGKKKEAALSVPEIHSLIINHISSLSRNRKINLINSESSGFDAAIEHIQKQKQIELSKALRKMCADKTEQNTEQVNAIIPDFDIKLETLPEDMIQALSSTLDFDFGIITEGQENPAEVVTEPVIKFEPAEVEEFQIISDEETPQVKTECTSDHEELDQGQRNASAPPEVPQITINNFPIDAYPGRNLFSRIAEREDPPENFVEVTPVIENSECTEEPEQIHPILPQPQIQNDSPPPNTDSSKVSVATQTDDIPSQSKFSDASLTTDPTSLDEAIVSMFKIDQEIERLTKLKQALFLNLSSNQKRASSASVEETSRLNGSISTASSNEPEVKKRKLNTEGGEEKEGDREVGSKTEEKGFLYTKPIDLSGIAEKVLGFKIIRNTLVATTASGKLLYINPRDGTVNHTVEVSRYPLSSMVHWCQNPENVCHIFVGSIDQDVKVYNFESRQRIRTVPLSDRVLCMEIMWDYLFMGTVKGDLIRYSLRKNKVEFQDNISPDTIRVIRATQEGARRVLLVGSKKSAVHIRDAISGLNMRILGGIFILPTVNTILLDKSVVYCGTTSHDIPAYSFHNGSIVAKYKTADSKEVTCLKMCNNLLYASCCDGKVYVYNTEKKSFVGTMAGPGGAIVSLEVVDNLVIISTAFSYVRSMIIPPSILNG